MCYSGANNSAGKEEVQDCFLVKVMNVKHAVLVLCVFFVFNLTVLNVELAESLD